MEPWFRWWGDSGWKLCKLFGKDAAKSGFLEEESREQQ
jgi:hypothetical protein